MSLRAAGSQPVRHPSSRWGAALAVAGGLILLALWGGPLPGLARVSFSAHMVLHLGILAVAAPVLSFALVLSGWQVPERALVPAAIAAAFLDLVVVWAWHAPGLHAAAARADGLFALQQGMFLLAGMAVWTTSFSGRSRRAAAAGAGAMGMSFMHMSMLGVVLATAPALIYPPELCSGGLGGLSPLDDQRLGGVLMAVGGAFPYLAGSVILLARMLSERA